MCSAKKREDRIVKKRILACLLALVMLIGAMPVMALAAEPEAEKPASFDWEVSKSKTATALDADGSTRVTLSLPSAEETLTSDVVFVLDGSSSADANVVKESLKLLDELKQWCYGECLHCEIQAAGV